MFDTIISYATEAYESAAKSCEELYSSVCGIDFQEVLFNVMCLFVGFPVVLVAFAIATFVWLIMNAAKAIELGEEWWNDDGMTLEGEVLNEYYSQEQLS